MIYFEIWQLHWLANGKGDILFWAKPIRLVYPSWKPKTQQLAYYLASKRCFFHTFTPFWGGGALLATWDLAAASVWTMDKSPFKNGKTRVQNPAKKQHPGPSVRSAPSPGSRTQSPLVGHEWTHHYAFSLSCCCYNHLNPIDFSFLEVDFPLYMDQTFLKNLRVDWVVVFFWKAGVVWVVGVCIPICSMYGIFTYICPRFIKG